MMKYDIRLFEQLNEEYRFRPIRSFFHQTDPESQVARARSQIARLSRWVSLEGRRVLEVGCGRGYLSAVLAGERSCSVTGIDIKERDEWDSLRRSCPDVEYKIVDLCSENPFDAESFDLIVSLLVWEHVMHPFTMLRECRKLLKPSGAMYISVNPYRSPTGSHRCREVFFPFPHLLFEDDVFIEYYSKQMGNALKPARLNRLTYSHYKEYFRILNLRIEHEDLRRVPLDRSFYERFRDKLERYPMFDLEVNGFSFLLRKRGPASGALTVERSLVEWNELQDRLNATLVERDKLRGKLSAAVGDRDKLKGKLNALENSFSYRLGTMLGQAVMNPGRNTLLLPCRLSRLLVRGAREHRRRCLARSSGATEAPGVMREAEIGRMPSRHAAWVAPSPHDRSPNEDEGVSEHRRFCAVCESWSPRFLKHGITRREDARCPHCRAVERHRLFWLYVSARTDLLDGKPKRMLHVAPEPALESKLRQLLGENYVTADLSKTNVMVKMDITSIGCPPETFDIIYCSHVLEHVDDDRKAMRELHRVLKRSGWAILDVPIAVYDELVPADKTIEDATITDPDQRLKAFGQNDHVRRYGPDYVDRLREEGFTVAAIKVHDLVNHDEAVTMGLSGWKDALYYCTRQ